MPPARESVYPEFVAIALGSNLGDRAGHIRSGADALASLPLTSLAAISGVHETAPVGPVAQGMYLNAAATLRTLLTPVDLLTRMLAIESRHGRDRRTEQRWGARTLDLDLLLYGTRTISVAGLTVPHPRMLDRAFVLRPLAEIAPAAEIPGSGLTVSQALHRLGEAP